MIMVILFTTIASIYTSKDDLNKTVVVMDIGKDDDGDVSDEKSFIKCYTTDVDWISN